MRLPTLLPLLPFLTPFLLSTSALPTTTPSNSNSHSALMLRADSDASNNAVAQAVEALFAAFASFAGSGSGSGSGQSQAAASTGASAGSSTGSGTSSGSGSGGMYYDSCTGAEGSQVSRVDIAPCQGGSGAQGSPCVFTQGQNYTITITFTSPSDVPQTQARTGLASYDEDQKTAYSGQSFSACTYTSCPVQAGVQATYTYPFKTLAAPPFDRLVFNATNGVGGPSIMCASVPASFQASS